MVDTVYVTGEVQPLRERLIDCARELLNEGGIDAVGLRAVARRAGVSHGAPRRYFPTHKALLASLAAAGFAELSDQLHAVVETTPDPVDRLRRSALTYVAFAAERRNLFDLMFRHDVLEGSGIELRKQSRPLFEAVITLVGEAGAADPRAVALQLWTQLHGVAVLRAAGSIEVVAGPVDAEAFVSRMIEVYLRP
ncbi:TetR/AcrR family transcriptional regulator [Rhodococcus tibetensis]|uniref:TetR/AcrR family transcriptional regulator n=1 Tax=Rhodococcus tibetensis TaxID=2965064 RepID=A0ABT1QGY1_9NOCA|nr:TetR/AcrR family transcriptional regulator [Rhodococcus sp. FXJ9.536]MCQ4120355.1 TetR/AcrR family transcriptional regulator [Rhodococcus sp. FXJ9.536]